MEIKNQKLFTYLGASIHMIDLVNWMINDLPISIFTKAIKLVQKKVILKHSFLTHYLTYKNNLIVKISSHATSVHPHFHELKIFEKDKTITLI